MNQARPPISDFLKRNAPLAFLALAHLPFLTVYFGGLWKLEHYQFFPFALAALGGLYFTRSERTQLQLTLAGKVAIALDVILLIMSTLAFWPKLAAVGFVLLCFAVTSATWEQQFPRRMTSLTLIPLILITPPRGMDLHAIFWLQQKTTWLSSRLLESMGYLHLRRGNIIELPDKQLLVEEACSGVQSLFTVLFLAIFIVCWKRRSLLQTALLLPSAVLFAGTMNVFRIVAIAVAWQEWQMDLVTGWMHDALGYMALLVAILLLLSTDSLLQFLFAPFRDHLYGPFAGLYQNPFTMLWNFVCGAPRPRTTPAQESRPPRRLILGGCVALAVLAGGVQSVLLATTGPEVSSATSTLSFFQQDLLPQEIEGFTVNDYTTETRAVGNQWGEFSHIWKLSGHGLAAIVSCDHPFRDWHYLNLCYTGNGWRVEEPGEFKDDPKWHSANFDMQDQQNGRHGCVIYSMFTGNGRPRQPSKPTISLRYAIERVRLHTSRGLWSLILEPVNRTSYQVQLFAQSGRPITEEQLAALRKLHLATRDLLRQHYIEKHTHHTEK